MIKQTESQNLGRAGERWFQSILPKEWIFQRPEEDIGLDGKVIIGTSNFTGGFEFAVQIKTSKQWHINDDNTISAKGINRETVKYWGSRLFPTMIVLYDFSKDCGYYGWLFDVLFSPIDLISSPHKTITLNLNSNSLLNKNCWETVRQQVESHYIKLVNSLSKVRTTTDILPIINSLLNSLRLLIFSQYTQPKSKNELMLLQLSIVVAHKSVINSLEELLSKYHIEHGSPNHIQYFIETYYGEVNKFILGFDEQLKQKSEAVAVRINPEKMYEITPKLISMIMNLAIVLSDETSNYGERNQKSN